MLHHGFSFSLKNFDQIFEFRFNFSVNLTLYRSFLFFGHSHKNLVND